jgi:glucose-6-phosphate 1-dehydrogenase
VSLIFQAPDDGPLHKNLPALGNVLAVSLAGSGAVHLRVVVKEPGADFTLTCGDTELPLSEVAEADPLPPYVKLIRDVIVGDRSLFTRPDGLASAWEAITPVLEKRPEVLPYARGSWGPEQAQEIAAPDGWLIG